MKIWEWLIVLLCSALIPATATAQCGTIRTVTYDSTVNGTGSADPGYTFSMPKFNATLGTLVNVKVASVVTVSFSYTIENRDMTPGNKTTKVRVNRYDEISGPSFDTASDYYSPITTYSLPPSDGVSGSGPDFRSIPPYYILNQDTVVKAVLSNTADFIGTGNVQFNYLTDLASQVSGNINVNLLGSATDNIKFSVTYTYCDNILLASEITAFSAAKKTDYINIIWLTANETTNHSYELQKSYDGVNFEPVTAVASHPGVNNIGKYEYNYVPQSKETGKIYFRVKQIGDGPVKYSATRMVDLSAETNENKAALRLVPNPSNGAFAIMLVNSSTSSDWIIELFNMKGQVVNKKQALNSTLAKFSMNVTLPSGVYFVMVTNKKSNQKFVERMVVN